jgi:hypothetical protein
MRQREPDVFHRLVSSSLKVRKRNSDVDSRPSSGLATLRRSAPLPLLPVQSGIFQWAAEPRRSNLEFSTSKFARIRKGNVVPTVLVSGAELRADPPALPNRPFTPIRQRGESCDDFNLVPHFTRVPDNEDIKRFKRQWKTLEALEIRLTTQEVPEGGFFDVVSLLPPAPPL